MAAIGINVNKDGLWSVNLDRFEWTALKADGHQVTKINDEWKYAQTKAGDFSFTATAVGTQFLNAQQNWSLQCGEVYYYLVLDYKITKNVQGVDNGFILNGRGFALNQPINLVKGTSHGFSQGKMMGVFSVDCA